MDVLEILELDKQMLAIYTTLTEGIDEDDVDARAHLQQMFQAVSIQREEQVVGHFTDLCLMATGLEAQIAAAQATIAPVLGRIQSMQRSLATLTEHWQNTMLVLDLPGVKTVPGTFTHSLYDANTYDEDTIPRVPENWVPHPDTLDKKGIAARKKAGEKIEGVGTERRHKFQLRRPKPKA